jgi:NitT/TauT family transport system substrate-binding protein
MKIAVPDMVSNSYFPVLAAAELGFFRQQGLDVRLELMSPADKAYAAMHEDRVDLVGAEAHAALAIFPEWKGMKLLCAQAQGMYWFLVMRADLDARQGDVGAVRGRRIGAAPWVELGLRRLLAEAGIDPDRDEVRIAPVPGSLGLTVNTGVTAAEALERGVVDGFWANGMGAEIAVRRGVGTVVLDVRRGDGPKGCFDYTLASLAATDRSIARSPDRVAAAIRAVVATHSALKQDVTLAEMVGRKLFPPAEAELISELIRRDLPFYDPRISVGTVTALNQFAREVGLLGGHPPYEDVVAVQFRHLWESSDFSRGGRQEIEQTSPSTGREK